MQKADAMSDLSGLEVLAFNIQAAGQEWVEAKLMSDQLEADEKSYLSALINDLEKSSDEKISETKLERLARGSKPFRDYIRGRVIAQAETNRRKVNYEGLQSLFEAKRSELSLVREKISKGIYDRGAG